MPGEQARFAFLGQSAVGRRMTAEDEGTAVWIRSLKYAGVAEDIVLNVSDAILYVTRCLTDSGATSEVVWRQFDLLAGRRLWLSCSEPAAVRRKSRPVHRIEHGVTVVQSGSDDTASHCLSQVVS